MTREEALQQAARLKVEHNLSAWEIGKAAAAIRVPLGNGIELDNKRIDFISSLADDTAPQQFQSLASEVKGELKYKFDRDWFAVSHVLETDGHYIATLVEDGRIRRYEKALYDFRPDGEQ